MFQDPLFKFLDGMLYGETCDPTCGDLIVTRVTES